MYYPHHPNYYYPLGYYPAPYPTTYPYLPAEKSIHNSTRESDMERQGDQGANPYVVNIERAANRNHAFRRTIWTGRHLQVTLMRLLPGEDIGAEIHPHTDQFLRLEGGHGLVQMGDQPNHFNFERNVKNDDAIFVPAGKWHNLTNTGSSPLVLYSIYAPPEHPKGTVHQTKAEAIHHHNHQHSRSNSDLL